MNKVKNAGVHHLVKHQHSVHVLTQLLNKIHPTNTVFILEFLEANFTSTCKDKYGICLVKAAQSKSAWIQRLTPLIIANARELSQDPFGNFSVQNLLE